jgi:hypothetical protein
MWTAYRYDVMDRLLPAARAGAVAQALDPVLERALETKPEDPAYREAAKDLALAGITRWQARVRAWAEAPSASVEDLARYADVLPPEERARFLTGKNALGGPLARARFFLGDVHGAALAAQGSKSLGRSNFQARLDILDRAASLDATLKELGARLPSAGIDAAALYVAGHELRRTKGDAALSPAQQFVLGAFFPSMKQVTLPSRTPDERARNAALVQLLPRIQTNPGLALQQSRGLAEGTLSLLPSTLRLALYLEGLRVGKRVPTLVPSATPELRAAAERFIIDGIAGPELTELSPDGNDAPLWLIRGRSLDASHLDSRAAYERARLLDADGLVSALLERWPKETEPPLGSPVAAHDE